MQVSISLTKLRVGRDNVSGVRGWELRLLLGGLSKLPLNAFNAGGFVQGELFCDLSCSKFGLNFFVS